MDLQPLKDALQGALWRRDRRLVLVVCKTALPKELAGHPRIKAVHEPPAVDDPLLQKTAIIIFCRPCDRHAGDSLARQIAQRGGRPKTFFYDNIPVTIEEIILDRLDLNPLPGERPREVKRVATAKPLGEYRPDKRKLFARGELTAFILDNAQPEHFSRADDVRRLYALIADKPGAPNLATLRSSYYALIRPRPDARLG